MIARTIEAATSYVVTLWELFYAFGKVGIFGFGGGPSFIPLVQQEVVTVNQWMTAEEFIDALAVGNTLPGPIATKMAAYVGYQQAGALGAAAGLLGMILPSALLMLALMGILLQYKDTPRVAGMLHAVRPALIALLALVVWELWPSSVRSWDTLLITLVAFAAVALLRVHPALAIVVAAIFGALVYGRS